MLLLLPLLRSMAVSKRHADDRAPQAETKDQADDEERVSLLVEEGRDALPLPPKAAVEDKKGKEIGSDSPPNNMLRMASLVVLVIQNTALVLSLRFSRTQQSDTDAPLYLASTAVVCAEALKLAVCLLAVAYNNPTIKAAGIHLQEHLIINWRDSLKLAVPSLIYAVQNNILYFALENLDAAVYQVLYQLKLLTTALMSVLILRRQLTPTKWVSLCMLTAGVALVQLYGSPPKDDDSSAAVSHGNSTAGLIAVLTACMTSAFAGVYFEKILKGSPVSIWVRNIQLAFFGIIFGGIMMLSKDGATIAQHGFFVGYSPLVWTVVAQSAFGGLVVAMVVKYADNILKGFALSISIILSSMVAMRYQNFRPTQLFVAGASLVVAATFVYNRKPKTPSNS